MTSKGKNIGRRGFLIGAASLLLAACAPRENGAPASSGASSQAESSAPLASEDGAAAQKAGVPTSVEVPDGAKVLLVYFSRPGMNNYGMGTGTYRDLRVGYTKTVAGYLERELGCDTFEIEPADPYPHNYRKTVARNVREEEDEVYPEIANIGELGSIDGYDVIIMGSPVWNSQSPMIMRTFLRSFDFSGKIILPFTTYDMSELGSVPEDYAALASQAQVSDAGLAVYECDAQETKGRQQAHDWLAGFGLVRA